MNREALPACAGCGRRFHPEPGAPFVCSTCQDDDEQAPTGRQPWDIPFPRLSDVELAHQAHMENQ